MSGASAKGRLDMSALDGKREANDFPELPAVLRQGKTDEYSPRPLGERATRAVSRVVASGQADARRTRRPLSDYWSGRTGTAAGLLALNTEFGHDYYELPADASLDADIADEAFDGDEAIIDVHTHFMAPRESLQITTDWMMRRFRDNGPSWWRNLDGMSFYSFAEYLRCVFTESETALAVLTTPPADSRGIPFLSNEEVTATRELFERTVGAQRLLCHASLHPTEPGSLDTMEHYRDLVHPVAWKVYTMGRLNVTGVGGLRQPGTNWMLDDEQYGLPFLERSRELGVQRICTHKGLSDMTDNGSPRDIGPCARQFPDLRFGVYHSGYEIDYREGPYTEETRDGGVNRLVSTLIDEGIGPDSNVFSDLGTTWYYLIKRPDQAAHVLGKLLLHVGENNVLWGTDGIWYGSPQPVIDAFRVFQIPDELCARYGYPKITPEIREKILGRNAARFYDIDYDAVRELAERGDLGWVDEMVHEFTKDADVTRITGSAT
jgi:hypothetical protein